ncbi:MAG: hypothetical protein LUG91_00185 [Ruminococcus sp.]|nr:hypothetical protein [Ruminococcus sp.]
MTVNTKLSLFDYLAMVENIASEFIDEKSGVYQPHIGQLNAMRLFYNFCVTESKFDDKYEHNIIDAEDMEEIVADEEFIEAFNNAIRPDVYLDICYDFACAYADAMEIVNVKKTSLGNVINAIGNMINSVFENISSVFTEDNIGTISQIAEDMSKGKVSAEAIVDAYAKKMFDSNSTES